MADNILYFDCSSGISGDMTVAALLDLGADPQVLKEALNSLPLDGYTIEIKEIYKSGIRACDFDVILEHSNHDHDMDYLHGTETHAHQHSHGTQEAHTHQHSRGTQETYAHQHSHDARNLQDITEIIRGGHLTAGAQELAIRIFTILAKAEASVHGKPIQDVHFHEVGAVDSIVDIVSVAVCIDNLQPDRILFSPLTDGQGQIRCQHGLIPVPVPAVAAIAADSGIVLKSSSIQGELVTPTGAAIAAALISGHQMPSEYRILKTGFGAGKRDYATTGLLRVMQLEEAIAHQQDRIISLETNIDDCTGEALAYTMQLLLEAGALDVFYQPIYMKKNRPAYLLHVLCTCDTRTKMEAIIFRNTTTIGIRMQEMQRTTLKRNIIALETPWGMADIKCCTCDGEMYCYPENDSIAALAQKENIGFPEMYSLVQAYARRQLINS